MYLLSKEHIYLIHTVSIEDFGGRMGFFNHTDSMIESILAQQYPVFGYDKYPTIFDKAAMLLYFFTKGHCFVDGNKRVGINTAIVLLTLNNYKDFLNDKEGYQKTVMIASSQIHENERDKYIKELATWLSYNFK